MTEMVLSDDLRTITLWCRHISASDGSVNLLRRVLHYCSWREHSIKTILNTGQALDVPVLCRVFDEKSGLTYIPPHIWNAKEYDELVDYWTCDISTSPATLIAPFESNHEFGSFTDTAAATTAEHAFIRDPLNAGVTRAVEVNNNSGKQYTVDNDGNISIIGTGRLGSHIRIRVNARK